MGRGWVQIPLRPTFYSCFKESFGDEYHVFPLLLQSLCPFLPHCVSFFLSLSLPHCVSPLFSLCPSLVLNLYLSLSVFACHCLSVCLTFCLVICPSFCIFIFYLNFMFSFRILSVNFVLHAILFHFISYFLQNLIFKSCLMSLPINLNFPELDVSVTIGNPVFCLASYLTGVHFRGKLQHVGDVSVDQSELEN